MKKQLVTSLIRLGSVNADLQPHLKPILDHLTKNASREDDVREVVHAIRAAIRAKYGNKVGVLFTIRERGGRSQSDIFAVDSSIQVHREEYLEYMRSGGNEARYQGQATTDEIRRIVRDIDEIANRIREQYQDENGQLVLDYPLEFHFQYGLLDKILKEEMKSLR